MGLPISGSFASSFGTCPNTVYFSHPETNYYEYGEVQKIAYETCSIRLKDFAGSLYVVPMAAAVVVGTWTAGLELYHIHPLGGVEKAYIAEDAKGSEKTIKISRNSFLKTVAPDQLKFSSFQINQLLSMGDAGRCFLFYTP